MPIKQVLNKGNVPVKIWADNLELEAYSQMENISKLPFIHKHVAVMPDAHVGRGCTIGSVIPTLNVIIPATVGVDIGCGMMAVKTNINAKELPESLKDVRHSIERSVPIGTGQYFNENHKVSKFKPYWFIKKGEYIHKLYDGYNFIKEKYGKALSKRTKRGWENQIGTLGGGNHFIEICLDQENNVWVMLHSGSRGIGNQIGRFFIELAKEDMRVWQINLPDRNLSYFPEGTEHFNDYWKAVKWAQDFAYLNRQEMMDNVFSSLLSFIPYIKATDQVINCHHNYVDIENHFGRNVYITRKGAIRAREGDRGIIPGSMGAKSFIVTGKGNPDSFHSCSHGAGRVMSRRKAKETVTEEDFIKQVKGVECEIKSSRFDEAPSAYKNIDEVMDNQQDLVSIDYTLKQVLCVKGD